MGMEGFSSGSVFTAGDSPITRFFKSIFGVFIGILFIPLSFIVVFFTEGRRELAPIVQKKAKPVDAGASAQGLVKFTAKPEGTPVKDDNFADPLVTFSTVEGKWKLGEHTAKEEEKIKNGNRTDTITRTITYKDFFWNEGEGSSKTMESIAFNGLKADPRTTTKTMGQTELYNAPPLKFLKMLDDAKTISSGESAPEGTVVRIDKLSGAQWSKPSADRFSGTDVKPDQVIAYRWTRVITFAKEKRSVKRDDWSAAEFKKGGKTIAASEALFYGWREVYSKSAGSETVKEKSYDATETLQVIEAKGPILVIGKVAKSGDMAGILISTLSYEDTITHLKDTKHPTAGLRRVVVTGLPFGPPLFVVGDASGGTIGKGPTDLFIISGKSEADTIAELAAEDALIKWLGRIGGFLLLWIGMNLIGAPLVAFLELFPFIGGWMGEASGCLIAFVTLPLALALILIEVLLIKLWWALLLLLLVAVIVGMVRHKSKAAAAPAAA